MKSRTGKMQNGTEIRKNEKSEAEKWGGKHLHPGAVPDVAPSPVTVHAVIGLHRRLVATLRGARSSWHGAIGPLAHITAPAPRCLFAECSIFMARSPGGLPYLTRPSLCSRHSASRWRRPTPRSVRLSNPSHMTTCSSAVCDTLYRRLTWHHLPPQRTQRLVHIAAPKPRYRVAKCSIFVVRGPGGFLLFSTSRILAHHRHPGVRFRTHPQHARAHGRRNRRRGSVLHCTQCHTRRSRSYPSSVCHRAHAVSPPFFFSLSLSCTTARAFPTAGGGLACTLACSPAHGRPTNERCDVRSAGVADWKTALGGEYGAYAHRCGGPLSSRPLSPRPCNAAAPKGPAF